MDVMELILIIHNMSIVKKKNKNIQLSQDVQSHGYNYEYILPIPAIFRPRLIIMMM